MTLLKAVLLGLIAFLGPISFATDEGCDRLLTNESLIRHFRKAPEFNETRTGFWTSIHGRLVFVPDGSGREVITQRPKNFASHDEIIARQFGDSSPEEVMAEVEDPNGDLEPLLNELSLYAYNEDLPQALEDRVFRALTRLERLATPMTDWLRPKVLNKRLNQLYAGSFQDTIVRRISPDVLIYKANQVKVRLNGVKTFFVSSGYHSIADSVHLNSVGALKMIVPNARISEIQPGYIIISSESGTTFEKGRIEFVTKGEKRVLKTEYFNFNPSH